MKKTKRIISLLLTVLLLFSLSVSICASDEISVYVDNRKVQFDVPPQLIGGRTMVPLRAIFEALGATVSWDAATRTVTAYNETTVVKATIDVNIITVNYVEKTMDIAPMIVDNRTLVPARFVAEAFDCTVNWDGNTKTVSITSKPIDYNEVEKDTGANTPTPTPAPAPAPAPSTSGSYYSGTGLPTYTSVTGVRLIGQDKLSNGKPVYMYKYTSSEDVGDYWGVLFDNGWTQIGYDDKTTPDVFETGFYKGDMIFILNVYLDDDEVWITYGN